jgi:hypothetical protein
MPYFLRITGSIGIQSPFSGVVGGLGIGRARRDRWVLFQRLYVVAHHLARWKPHLRILGFVDERVSSRYENSALKIVIAAICMPGSKNYSRGESAKTNSQPSLNSRSIGTC